jgi:hypothetical protein
MTKPLVLGDPAADRLELTRTNDVLSARLSVSGLDATTEADWSQAAVAGWQGDRVSVAAPQGGLGELFAHLLSHPDGWDDSERWQSPDTHLELTFSHHPASGIVVAVVLRRHQPSGWVAYGKLTLSRAELERAASALTPLLPAAAGS